MGVSRMLAGFNIQMKLSLIVQIEKRVADSFHPADDQVGRQQTILANQGLQIDPVDIPADQILAAIYRGQNGQGFLAIGGVLGD